jgi:hypothetical protein
LALRIAATSTTGLVGLIYCIGAIGYMPEHLLAAPVMLIMAVAGTCAAWWAHRIIKHERAVLALFVIGTVMNLLTPASALWPGGITDSRFGVTVVGVMPLPAFDVRISAGGVAWFRAKSHRVTLEEAQPLLQDADVLVIATGWHGVVQVDPAVAHDPRVRALRTGEAVEPYRQLRAQGIRVAIILHSTC